MADLLAHSQSTSFIARDLLCQRVWAIDAVNHSLKPIASIPSARQPSSKMVAPAFYDVQVNGLMGIDFADPNLSREQLQHAQQQLWQQGIGWFLATLITNSADSLQAALERLVRWRDLQPATATLAGIHLEGPFISPIDGPRGAHPKAHCQLPSIDLVKRWQDASQGTLRMMTLAPELPGAIGLIEYLVDQKIVVAIGHTAAHASELDAGVRAGAILSTHLGNGCADQIQRHHNIINDQLGDDRLHASLIADGWHLPPGLLKSMVRAKTPSRCLLVSDAVHLAGLSAGVYEFGGQPVELGADGAIRIVGQPRLAGSTLTLANAVANTVTFAGITLAQAWPLASTQPRLLMEPTACRWSSAITPLASTTIELKLGDTTVPVMCVKY